MVALGELAPNMPVATQTAFASLGGATWRIMLTPVDTLKTTLQVQGSAGAVQLLKDKVKAGGIGVLYGGAAANFAANWVGTTPGSSPSTTCRRTCRSTTASRASRATP